MVNFGNKRHSKKTVEKLIGVNYEVTEGQFLSESLASSSAFHTLLGL